MLRETGQEDGVLGPGVLKIQAGAWTAKEKERLDGQRQDRERRREAALLSLVGCYQEQLHLLEQQVLSQFGEDQDKKAAWENQFRTVSDCIRKELRTCAAEETGQAGEPVDFGIHQVLSAAVTEDPMLEGQVAEVFCPGLIYHGETIKKAKVAAYRRTKDGIGDRN